MNRHGAIWMAAALLFALFAAMVMSARLKSPTYDEPPYIVAGYAFVKMRDLHILTGEPVLLAALQALPLLALPDLRLPVDHPSWAGTNFHPIAEQFMWHVNDNADQILFLARVPTMLLTLLLVAFVYRWGREAFGPWGGMLALFLCAFDPNLIAHGQLAATDLGSMAFIFITTYWIWRLLCRPGWQNLLASGVFLGLAQASRFSALLFGPGWAALFLWRAFVPPDEPYPQPFALAWGRRRPSDDEAARQPWLKRLGWLAVAGVLIVLIAYLTVGAVYGFQIGPVRGLTSFPVLAPAFFEELVYISARLSGAKDPAVGFLLGELYVGGKWQYFPVAFALKTTIPTLILFLGAVVSRIRSKGMRRGGMHAEALWLPPLIYFVIALNSKLNLGYRYILPVLPFVIVLAGGMGQRLAEIWPRLRGARRATTLSAICITVGWLAWNSLSIYPHYLAFFNEWAGGPDNGWRYLVDSNIDWGQDLKLLKRWMDQHGVEQIKLAYYGEGVPSYYGIDFDPLICAPDRWEHPLYHDLYLDDPAPGIYAISANLLQGRNLTRPETYHWFREREPIDKVGYSIFIYRVPRRGDGHVVLVLSGVTPPDIKPEDYARLGTNDVRVLWADAGRALIWPANREEVFLFADAVHPAVGESPIHPALGPLVSWKEGWSAQTRDGRAMRLFRGNSSDRVTARVDVLRRAWPVWHLPAGAFEPGDPELNGRPLALPVGMGWVELLAYEMDKTTLAAQDTLTLVTYWRIKEAIQEPTKLFVHLLDAGGAYRAGEDRMDVWYGNWQPGDVLAQVQEIKLDAAMEPGTYQVEIGWYTPQTMARFPVWQDAQPIADRLLLEPTQVGLP